MMAVTQYYSSSGLSLGAARADGHGNLRTTALFLPTRAIVRHHLPINRGFSSCTGLSLLKLRLLPLTARRPSRTSACYQTPPPPPPSSGPATNHNLLVSLAIAIAIPAVGGALASFFYAANADWYTRLRKPDWNPPAWLFGAAWAVLYALMGFASWLVWANGGWEGQGNALSLYALQLLLNLAWPALFFGAKNIVLALADIVALWVALVACIRAFQPINPIAARLLYPYLAWVTFATALNYSYLQLNSDKGGRAAQA